MRRTRISVEIGVVQVPGWDKWRWLKHGFSTREGGCSQVYGPGEANLGFTPQDDVACVRSNRASFIEAIAPRGSAHLITVRQVHGASVQILRTHGPHTVAEADGMMTGSTGLMLGVQVADCVPVLVADTRLCVVAAFHAGWRGTAAGIVERGIQKMMEDYGSEAQNMVGAVGPSIRSCCFEVGEELRAAFEVRFDYADELFRVSDSRLHLDLAEANRRQMVDMGIPRDAVTVLNECTACTHIGGRRKYFSHRADRGITGRGMGAIGVGES